MHACACCKDQEMHVLVSLQSRKLEIGRCTQGCIEAALMCRQLPVPRCDVLPCQGTRDGMSSYVKAALTVRAEDCGGKGAPRTQQLPAHSLAQAAQVLCQQRHRVPVLVKHCVAVGLLKAQDHCAPACSRASGLQLPVCDVRPISSPELSPDPIEALLAERANKPIYAKEYCSLHHIFIFLTRQSSA